MDLPFDALLDVTVTCAEGDFAQGARHYFGMQTSSFFWCEARTRRPGILGSLGELNSQSIQPRYKHETSVRTE